MADRASTKPIASFESEGIPALPTTPSSDSYLTNNGESDDTDYDDEEEASVEVVKDPDKETEKKQKKDHLVLLQHQRKQLRFIRLLSCWTV